MPPPGWAAARKRIAQPARRAGTLTARERLDAADRCGHVHRARPPRRHPHFSVRGHGGQARRPADGVVTGFGKVDGRLVAVPPTTSRSWPARWGMAGELKVARLRELALTKRLPIVWLLDSAGADPGGRRLAVRRLRASVPRGGRDERRRPAGGRADGPVRRGHRLHPRPGRLRADGEGPRLDGARPARTSSGRRSARTSPRRSSAARASATRKSGVGDLEVPDDEECIDSIKGYLSYLPVPQRASAPPLRGAADPVERMDEELLDVLPESNRKPYDMYDVITADRRRRRVVGPEAAVGAGRSSPAWRGWAARPVGIVANQPRQLGGILDNDSPTRRRASSTSATRSGSRSFSCRTCPASWSAPRSSRRGSSATGRRCCTRWPAATVPKITVVLRKAYGARLLRDERHAPTSPTSSSPGRAPRSA